MSNALVGRNIGELEKQQYINSGPSGDSRGTSSEGVVCYYCHKPGHVIRNCKKRQREYFLQREYIKYETVKYSTSLITVSLLRN